MVPGSLAGAFQVRSTWPLPGVPATAKGRRASRAAWASTRPAPTASAGAFIDVAVSSSSWWICAGVMSGAASTTRAATAAAWGAAADVPKNRLQPSEKPPKKVVQVPSVAVMSGLSSTFGVASGADGFPVPGNPGPTLSVGSK